MFIVYNMHHIQKNYKGLGSFKNLYIFGKFHDTWVFLLFVRYAGRWNLRNLLLDRVLRWFYRHNEVSITASIT